MSAPYPCLILTPWMALHGVVRWEKAIVHLFTGEIDVLESYEETASSPSVTIRFPAVGRLVKHMSRDKHDIKYSRTNLYARDGYRCMYCGEKFTAKELTYDHVVPRAKGGKTDWANVVAACRLCNTRKGARTPAQAGMKLLKHPVRPKSLPMRPAMIALPRDVPELWMPYLTDRLAKIAQWVG